MKIGFSCLSLHCQHKQSPSLICFEKNLIFRVREGNKSVQKTLLSFVEVENFLLTLLFFFVANSKNSDYSQHLSVYESDLILSVLPVKYLH